MIKTCESKEAEAGFETKKKSKCDVIQQSLGHPGRKLWTEYCPPELSSVGEKGLVPYVTTLLSHQMWAAPGRVRPQASGSLQPRQMGNELGAAGHLLTLYPQ